MTWWIATIWMGADATYAAESRHVVRLQALDEADYRAQVRRFWPGKVITFGPVGRSKVQT